MYTDNYEKPLARLHNQEISYTEFLKDAGCEEEYKKWCKSHHLKEEEGAAQCFFDHYGFEDTTVVKEYIEPA